MMDWTDKHCRFFHRQISAKAHLYTEMITAEAIIHGDQGHLLTHDSSENPLSLQLGGADPEKLYQATTIATAYNYDAFDLNIGCPSDRVQNARFGACLMLEPGLVADCLQAMQEAAPGKITVKCRIGVDEMDDDEQFNAFIAMVKSTGVTTVAVHARKAWLQGLSPKQNREIPPLNYPRVYRLKELHPDMSIIINGGIETLEEAEDHLSKVDGVMFGRAAYHTPYLLQGVDQKFYGSTKPPKTRHEIAEAMIPYIERHVKNGGRLHQITRHMLGLFHGQPGARLYRRILSTEAMRPNANVETFQAALNAIENKVLETETNL